MKISNLQKLLEEYKEMYGDIEINLHYSQYNTDFPLELVSFSAVPKEEDEPFDIKNISIWV